VLVRATTGYRVQVPLSALFDTIYLHEPDAFKVVMECNKEHELERKEAIAKAKVRCYMALV
jgi:hypothetical protein